MVSELLLWYSYSQSGLAASWRAVLQDEAPRIDIIAQHIGEVATGPMTGIALQYIGLGDIEVQMPCELPISIAHAGDLLTAQHAVSFADDGVSDVGESAPRECAIRQRVVANDDQATPSAYAAS